MPEIHGGDGEKAFTGPPPQHVIQQVHKTFIKVQHWAQLAGWMLTANCFV